MKNTNVLSFFLIALFLFINIVFAIKYGARLDFLNIYFSIFGSILLFVFPFFFVKSLQLSAAVLKRFFFIVVVLFFTFSIVLNIYVDGYSLNVDRWMAIDVTIRALLEGVYPYDKIDYLGNYSSNLPSITLLGLPFYFIGDIGFMQSFAFLVFSYIIYVSFKSYRVRLYGILLLIFSICYLYEIYVKSDLMSNFIFAMGFIVFWDSKFKNNTFKHPILLGSLLAFFALTRIPVLIPLVLYFFKDFISTSIKKKVYFLISAIFTVSFLVYIALKDVPSLDVLLEFNPLILQGNKSLKALSIISLVLPFIFSLKTKSILNVFTLSILIMLIPVLGHFIPYLSNYGFSNTIFETYADLAYFNLITPFLIFFLISFSETYLKIGKEN